MRRLRPARKEATMPPVTPPEDPESTQDPEPQPPNPAVEHADVDDDPDVDEVEIVDTDEFGEPIDESATDEDADDWDKSEI
jgi:hypothetical protein